MSGKTRPYRAPGREARARRTRAGILSAGHDAFARRGFSATIGEVADLAGVSRATVELAFGTKAALLDAIVDVALAGDDEPVPVLERSWVRDLAPASVADFLAAAAGGFAAGARRVSPLLRALEEGASGNASLTELNERLSRQRTVMAAWVVDGVVGRGALARDLTPGQAREVVLVLIDPVVHGRMLVDWTWTVDRLSSWLARSFQRLLVDPGAT